MLAGYEKDGKIAPNSASSAMRNSAAIPQRVAQIGDGEGNLYRIVPLTLYSIGASNAALALAALLNLFRNWPIWLQIYVSYYISYL